LRWFVYEKRPNAVHDARDEGIVHRHRPDLRMEGRADGGGKIGVVAANRMLGTGRRDLLS
jgi:hypothetical protein